MRKIKDYMEKDFFIGWVKKQSAEWNYEWFNEFFPKSCGEVDIYDWFHGKPFPRLTYSYDKNSIEFKMEDKEGNIDTLSLKWKNDVHHLTISPWEPQTIKISTVKGKFLTLLRN